MHYLNRNIITAFISNQGPADWLPQRRVARKAILPSRKWPQNTPSTFTTASMVGFKKHAPWAEIWKFGMKETETPDVHMDTRLNTAVQAKGIRNVPYCIQVGLSRKHNKDEDSPNSIHWLPMYLSPLWTIYRQLMWMRTGCWLSN